MIYYTEYNATATSAGAGVPKADSCKQQVGIRLCIYRVMHLTHEYRTLALLKKLSMFLKIFTVIVQYTTYGSILR